MTTKTFKPNLAGKAPANLDDLTYPVLASPKIDGIRCLIRDGRAVSRTLKKIPNQEVRAALEGLPHGIEGELIVEGGYNACQSFFMSKTPPHRDWWFFAFDWERAEFGMQGFQGRLTELAQWSEEYGHNNLRVVEHTLITNGDDLREYVAQQLGDGFEGAMVRDPKGLYKYGRSTVREGGLLKIKNFEDEEAVIFKVEEQFHNDNEATKDAFGRTKRSSHKENKRAAGTMGALVCRTMRGAVQFNIGTGFTQQERDDIWKNRKAVIGHIVKFRYQPDPGGRADKQVPRGPAVFIGFRDKEDISS